MSRLTEDVEFDGRDERSVRALAEAAGLWLYRPNKLPEGVEALVRDEEGLLWIVLLKMTFEHPQSRVPSFDAPHYVLVLDVTAKGIVVADPHPWHPAISSIPTNAFMEMWHGARGPRRTRWAGVLSVPR